MKPVTHMSYASSMGLTHKHCVNCQRETLHKGERCVHCEAQAVTPARQTTTQWSKQIERQAALRVARNRGLKALRSNA